MPWEWPQKGQKKKKKEKKRKEKYPRINGLIGFKPMLLKGQLQQKKKIIQTNDLSFHLKKLEKEKQSKPNQTGGNNKVNHLNL